MANNYGTDNVVLQGTTGSLQVETGDTLLNLDASGERAVIFGAVSTREIQTGLANGAFDSRPPLPDQDIDEEENPLAYWTVTDGSSGAITARAALEATNPSGYAIEVTVPNATTAGQSLAFSSFFPISGNSAETLALDPIFYLDAVILSGTANTEVRLDLSFADADYVATGGTASGTVTYASLITGGISPADKSVSTLPTVAPSAAAFGKLTLTVITTGTVATSGPLVVTLREAIVRRGFSFIPISDNVGNSAGTNPPGGISHTDGSVIIQSGQRLLDGTGAVVLSAVSSSTAVATLDVTSAVGTGIYRSADMTLTGVGVNPMMTFSSTSSAGDVNLYRSAADTWKTDDSFDIAGSLSVGGSATITGNLSAGGISFTNLSVSGTAYVAGSATFNSAVTATGPLTVGGTVILGVPPGSLQAYLGTTSNVPTGWVLANGASLSTATYPELYAVIGYRFGGSGANFNVPNLNVGYFLVGSTSSPGTAFMAGSEDSYLDATWNHTHSTDPAAFNSATSATAQVVQSGAGAGPSALSHVHSINVPATTSSNTGPDPLRLRVVYIIKT